MKNFLKRIFKKKLTPNDYHPAFVANTQIASDDNQYLIKLCKDRLSENRIPLNKIKFVFDKSFEYDVDSNTINPTYKTILPIKKKNPVIEIGKPINSMTVFLGENRTHNNYEILKKLAHKSKRGIVIYVGDIAQTDLDDVMWLVNLDDAYDYYYTNLEYDS